MLCVYLFSHLDRSSHLSSRHLFANGSLMKILFFACFVFGQTILSNSSFLTCLSHCSFSSRESSSSFDQQTCHNETNLKYCQGRLTVIYQSKSSPTFFNLTFGLRNDPLSLDFRNDMDENILEKLHFYQIVIDAERKETTIIIDVFCSQTNHCAWIDLNEHFHRHKGQLNPFYHLESSFYRENFSENVDCFDSSSRQIRQCSNRTEICLSSLKDLKQECSSQSKIFIRSDFLVPSPHTVALDRTTHHVQCNVDRCNTDEMLTIIESRTKQNAFGLVPMPKNSAEKRNENVFFSIFFIFVQFCLFTSFVQ